MLNPPCRLGVLTSKRWLARGSRDILDQLHELLPITCILARSPAHDGNRHAFDAKTAVILRAHHVDTVLLLGYLHIVTEPLLTAFPNRILNVHDADLTLRDVDGGPLYPGLHSTLDAIMAGESETRSSVHLVTPQLDAGPVLVRSEAFPVAPFVHEAATRGEHDIVRAYAYAQREWMMRSTWSSLAADAVRRLDFPALRGAVA